MNGVSETRAGMSLTTKVRLFIALVSAAVGSILSWYDVVSYPETQNNSFLNIWGILNIVPGIFSVILGGHAGSVTVFIVASFFQWLGIGWLVGLVVKPT